MIDKLTPEQEKELVIWRKKWFEIGSSCEPADKPRAEKAITQMYKEIGKEQPEIIWCTSPKDAIEKIKAKKEEEKQDVSVNNILNECWWGQNEAYWVAFYKFCRDVLGVVYEKDKSEKLDLWSEISQSCGWWWPYENFCFISDRPELVKWEEANESPRLHCENGPAIKFRDGYTVYAWHGIRVAEKLIERPETITVEEIAQENNVEMRRIMIERYGRTRYLQDSGAEMVQEDKYGKLWKKEVKDDEPICMVEVLNAYSELDENGNEVRKTYFLAVPPNMKTAHEAVAWTFFKTPEEYNPLVET